MGRLQGYGREFSGSKEAIRGKKDSLIEEQLHGQLAGLVTTEIYNQAETHSCKQLIKEIEESTVKRLAKECDVIALQNIGKMDRPFVTSLQEEGFAIYSIPIQSITNIFSTAIAIRTNAFESTPQNISKKSTSDSAPTKSAVPIILLPNDNGVECYNPLHGQEIAAVVATIKNTTLNIAFSSLHSWAFHLYPPDVNVKHRRYMLSDRINMASAVNYIKEVKGNLRIPRVIGTFMAGDMNNNPENQSAPFDRVRKKYDILAPDQATYFQSSDPYRYHDRKIDFVFVPKSTSSFLRRIWTAISTFFVCRKPVIITTPAKVLPGFDFTVEGNCSNHKPVMTTITIITESTISTFFNWLFSKSSQGK